MATESRDTKGILGEKLGMTQVFDENNRIVPVTVVKAGPCVVTQIRTPEKDGYTAVQLAYGQIDPRKVTKPVAGHFKAANVTPRRHLVELRTDSIEGYEVGQELGADVFDEGALRRRHRHDEGQGHCRCHEAARLPRPRRRPRHPAQAPGAGSIGACATPGRVFKGLRMAGRMGHERQTTQSLRVVKVDAERGLLLISGAIPGPNGGLVLVRTAAKGVTQ